MPALRFSCFLLHRLPTLTAMACPFQAGIGSKRVLGVPTHALLRELVLSGNNIGNGGVEMLCEALEVCVRV